MTANSHLSSVNFMIKSRNFEGLRNLRKEIIREISCFSSVNEDTLGQRLWDERNLDVQKDNNADFSVPAEVKENNKKIVALRFVFLILFILINPLLLHCIPSYTIHNTNFGRVKTVVKMFGTIFC